MRKKKGFTLMELTIVLAIIGILVAIVVPSWGFYLQRTRIKAQNHNAKIVYNAAQKIVTDLEFYERQYLSNLAATTDTTVQGTIRQHLYTPSPEDPDNNVWYFYCGNGYTGQSTELGTRPAHYDGTKPVVKDTFDKWDADIASTINSICGKDILYKVSVKNYMVTAVVTANSENDVYIGSYPFTLNWRKQRDEFKPIKGIGMTQFTAEGNGVDYSSS